MTRKATEGKLEVNKVGRQQNYSIGKKGEKRVMKILNNYGVASREHVKGLFPDFFFARSPHLYAIECKTVKAVHDGGKVGRAKISSNEYWAYNQMSKKSWTPCVIVEIRPRSVKEKDYIYFFIEWQKVKEYFDSTNTTKQLSLTLWWIIRNGINLNWWLKK